MERERYRKLQGILRQVERRHHSTPRCTHRDRTILLVLLWAALHDRPVVWATDPRHWPGNLRPRPLPSQSCMSRRLRTWSVRQLLDDWTRAMRDQLPDSDVKFIDARPLIIGACSKDPDARFGYATGRKAKGYKLHTVVDLHGTVRAWVVLPMNQIEVQAAPWLIEHLSGTHWLLGDNAYDRNRLYEQAEERGIQLLANLRPDVKALGHRQHSIARRRVWPWLRSEASRWVMGHRRRIEQSFGWMNASDVRLDRLPMHARRSHRVVLWVAIKLLLHTERIHARYRDPAA